MEGISEPSSSGKVNLTDEEMSEIAEKEALKQSILPEMQLPNAKVIHKGIEMIE